MIRANILTKAIEKAALNGYDIGLDDWHIESVDDLLFVRGHPDGMDSTTAKCEVEIIFDHDFAKALWGTKNMYHLQNMVIANDRIKYLGENLPA